MVELSSDTFKLLGDPTWIRIAFGHLSEEHIANLPEDSFRHVEK